MKPHLDSPALLSTGPTDIFASPLLKAATLRISLSRTLPDRPQYPFSPYPCPHPSPPIVSLVAADILAAVNTRQWMRALQGMPDAIRLSLCCRPAKSSRGECYSRSTRICRTCLHFARMLLVLWSDRRFRSENLGLYDQSSFTQLQVSFGQRGVLRIACGLLFQSFNRFFDHFECSAFSFQIS